MQKKAQTSRVPLSEILETHLNFEGFSTLRGNLGDGYLCRHNLIYKNVRDLCTHAGLGFTEDDYCDYFIFPLGSLDQILKSGKIPYKNNVRAIERLEKLHPGRFSLKELPDFHNNHVFHESCHCVFQSLSGVAPAKSGFASPEQLVILKALMSEAFASSCEKMGWSQIRSDVHRHLYAANSYMRSNLQAEDFFREVIDLIGFRKSFQLLFLSHLFSNFLYEELTPKGWKLIRALLGINDNPNKKKLDGVLIKFFKYGLKLSNRFKLETNAFYFKLCGIQGELPKLYDFNFLSVLFKSDELRPSIDTLADLVEYGVESPLIKDFQTSKQRLSALRPA